MNIFIIPSWYPSANQPLVGVFFREMAYAYAQNYPIDNIGISTWGQSNKQNLIEVEFPIKMLKKVIHFNPNNSSANRLLPNLIEYYQPALTWTRKFQHGNIQNIIKANKKNLDKFETEFGKVNLIHAHIVHPAGVIAEALSTNLKVPYTITENQSPFPFSSFLNANNNLLPLIMNSYTNSSLNIAVSEHMKRKMANYNIKNLTCISNYVSEQRFIDLPTKNVNRNMVFLGRLEPQKGLDILLEAMSLIDCATFDLIIIGDGSMKAKLHKRAKRLKKTITWIGEASANQVTTLLSQASFMILPSRHEGLPVAIIEALAAGVPVVATRCGGSEEMITTETGIVIEPENPKALSEAICTMTNTIDNYSKASIQLHFKHHYGDKVVCGILRRAFENILTM